MQTAGANPSQCHFLNRQNHWSVLAKYEILLKNGRGVGKFSKNKADGPYILYYITYSNLKRNNLYVYFATWWVCFYVILFVPQSWVFFWLENGKISLIYKGIMRIEYTQRQTGSIWLNWCESQSHSASIIPLSQESLFNSS